MSTTRATSPEREHEVDEHNAALRQEVEQLRSALVTRVVIEQAKGMLAERFGCHVDDAFERLRREARNRRMKLHGLAAAVVAREAWTEALFRSGGQSNGAGQRDDARRTHLSSTG